MDYKNSLTNARKAIAETGGIRTRRAVLGGGNCPESSIPDSLKSGLILGRQLPKAGHSLKSDADTIWASWFN